jgi:hypothetical protein
VEFANGTIELDIRGKDVQGQSFVGVALHGVDGTTYEAIYFRPFNFRAADSTRRAHAVQYISQPTHTWQKLRTEHPGMYENAVNPAPDPNGWFHARRCCGLTGERLRGWRDTTQPRADPIERAQQGPHGLLGRQWVGGRFRQADDPTELANRRIARAGEPSCPRTLSGSTIRS